MRELGLVNTTWSQKFKSCCVILVQYKDSREKLYQELGLNSLVERRCGSKLSFCSKIVNRLLSDYLYSSLNFAYQKHYPLRSAKASKIKPISTRPKSFEKFFLHYCINVWNDLKAYIRNAKSISIFKKLIPSKKHGNSLFFVCDLLGENLFSRLRANFSHLREYKFRHSFADTINSMCACRAEVETTEHILLCCHFYSIQRSELFDNLEKALTQTLKIWMIKINSHLCCTVQKQKLLKILIKRLSKS